MYLWVIISKYNKSKTITQILDTSLDIFIGLSFL